MANARNRLYRYRTPGLLASCGVSIALESQTLGLLASTDSEDMKLPDEAPHNTGKMLDHDAGLGEASNDMVEDRARELAMITGLEPDQVTDAHRRQAREELRGAADPNSPAADEDMSVAELTSYDDVPGESGHAVAPATNAAASGDEESIGEQLYAEGIAEAEHDTMVESREEELRDGREDESAR